jgi:hypothetical protein
MDFEDRILSAAKDAQKIAPMGRTVSRAISWAGSWAMRPQTAMAAVFILMVGSSVLFVRRRKVADNVTVTVTAKGAPAAFEPAPAIGDESASLDSKVAAAAHGAGPAVSFAPTAPVASAGAAAASAAPLDGVAGLGKEQGEGGGDTYGRRGAAVDDQDLSLGRPTSEALGAQLRATREALGAAQLRAAALGHDRGPVPARFVIPSAASDDVERNAPASTAASRAQTPPDQARSFYLARDYVAATNAYDAIAAGGDLDAALWAARSVRDGNGGCALAKDRFDQVAARGWGTTVGYEATLEGGKCYRALGAIDAAQAHYAKLLTVQQFAPLAQAEINAMTQVATRASLKRPAAGKPAAAAAIANPNLQQAPSEPAPSQQKVPPPQKATP